MKVYLKALGCRLNEAELASWAQQYIDQGDQITTNEQEADLIVFNSCSVTQQADKKSRQLLKRFHRNNPNAKVIATGCSSTLHPKQISQLAGISLVVENRQKEQLVALSQPLISHPRHHDKKTAEHQLFSRGRERAFIKVQDGCRYRCSFCIVTVARGEEKSVAAKEVVTQINRLQQQGIKEVILSGVHLGGYGSDIQSNLVELIKTVLANTEIPRIRLGSLEPWELSEDFFTLFANPRLMPHLHLPLQSGSDTILRKMARRCKSEDFARLLQQARQAHPDMNITTDIIVGFPGETDQLWQESFDFIRQCQFGHIHIFSYSKRQGTKAANLPDQVAPEVKKQRNQQLQRLSHQQQQLFMQQQKGKILEILWESKTETLPEQLVRQWGYSGNYLRVCRQCRPQQAQANQISREVITGVDSHNGWLLVE